MRVVAFPELLDSAVLESSWPGRSVRRLAPAAPRHSRLLEPRTAAAAISPPRAADSWAQALSLQSQPSAAAAAARQRAEIADIIWHAAGDASTDYNWCGWPLRYHSATLLRYAPLPPHPALLPCACAGSYRHGHTSISLTYVRSCSYIQYCQPAH